MGEFLPCGLAPGNHVEGTSACIVISSFWGLPPEPTIDYTEPSPYEYYYVELPAFVVPTAIFDCGEHLSFLVDVPRNA